MISWKCSLQKVVTLSTTEAEYISLGSATKEVLWLQYLSDETNWSTGDTKLLINVDNQSAIKLAKNPVFHNRTKHISTRHHFIRNLIENKILEVTHVATEENVADIFTKVLNVKQFKNLLFLFSNFWETSNSKMKKKATESTEDCNWTKVVELKKGDDNEDGHSLDETVIPGSREHVEISDPATSS